MTLYLLDANAPIRAHADFYDIERVPQFWDWLLAQAEAGTVKMPREIYGEVCQSKDLLGRWLRRVDVKRALVLDEPTNRAAVQRVVAQGYAPDLTDVELPKIGQDPFLVAAALGGADRVVVTREVSKPSAQRANRKIPDVCAVFRIEAITDYELYRRLDFRIA
jgi:hypothetical protein